ncbi:gata-type sexual development transcription factor, partial [Moniliophthora roreri]
NRLLHCHGIRRTPRHRSSLQVAFCLTKRTRALKQRISQLRSPHRTHGSKLCRLTQSSRNENGEGKGLLQ